MSDAPRFAGEPIQAGDHVGIDPTDGKVYRWYEKLSYAGVSLRACAIGQPVNFDGFVNYNKANSVIVNPCDGGGLIVLSFFSGPILLQSVGLDTDYLRGLVASLAQMLAMNNAQRSNEVKTND